MYQSGDICFENCISLSKISILKKNQNVFGKESSKLEEDTSQVAALSNKKNNKTKWRYDGFDFYGFIYCCFNLLIDNLYDDYSNIGKNSLSNG